MVGTSGEHSLLSVGSVRGSQAAGEVHGASLRRRQIAGWEILIRYEGKNAFHRKGDKTLEQDWGVV